MSHLCASLVLVGLIAGQSTRPDDPAWAAWQRGDMLQAQQLAAHASNSPQRTHLLINCAAAAGRYQEAIRLYGELPDGYGRRSEASLPVFHALMHLQRYEQAAAFAREQSMDEALATEAQHRAADPLKVTLPGTTEVPFAQHPLSEYFPCFEATINDSSVRMHLDTGGTWLVMGPDRAKALGIELVEAAEGRHGLQKVRTSRGLARRLQLGDAVIENVPVIGMPTLVGQQDFIIFGTNVLQQFTATLDYPGRRLLLAPRGENEHKTRQLQVHGPQPVEIPFYMWADHYMFVRGGFGQQQDLNFFVDSGLVAIGASQGAPRQACFATTPERYQAWGVPEPEATLRFFESDLPVSIGPLQQQKQFFTTTPTRYVSELGGVRIDGLISHAFLKRYVWTVDFDRMCYVFSEPNGGDHP